MSTPLTDTINALTTYANGVTGASDTTLSDAVHTLASGYGGGGDATLITKTITENGTYSAEDDDADGYSSVTVNVPTGITPTGTLNITANDTYDVTNYASAVVNVPSSAASSWTKVAETTYQVSTTYTSASTVATWETGHSEIWTSDKIVYIRIRDTAGKRSGYFYGTDAFYLNYLLKNSSSYGSTNNGLVMNCWYVTSNDDYGWRYGYITTGYGVYSGQIYSNGNIIIRSRYNSSYSLTIDGTYKVEVYLLDPPTGAPIFE